MVCIGISTWPPLLAHDSLQALPPGLFSLLGVQYVLFVVVIQSLSHVWLFQPQGLQHTRLPCSSLSPGVCLNSCPLSRWYCPTILSCHPLLPPSIFSSIKVFSNESALHIRWPKYWSFSFSISPSNGHLGWFSLGLTYSISLQSKGLLLLRTTSDISKVLSLSPVYPFPRRKWQ